MNSKLTATFRPTRRVPIVVRLVVSVLVAMAAVSLLGAAFVFWRVDTSLNGQLDQDLRAYRAVGLKALEAHDPIPEVGSFRYQIVDKTGRVLNGDIKGDVAPRALVMRAFGAGDDFGETGGVFDSPSYVWTVTRASYLGSPVVVLFAINRQEHDEALRELLAQLTLVGVLTLLAAAWIGYRTARAALDPVERYRLAASDANPSTRLPVDARDDELSRLGHTFNNLLDRIESSQERERRSLADASHELRAPLSVMRAEVEVALRRTDASNELRMETLESLISQIGRLEGLCNALLEWEELRSMGGGALAALEDLQVAEVISEVAARARRLPGLGERAIQTAVSPDLRARLHRHWIEVALDNLTSNAVRYGSGTITLGADSIPASPDSPDRSEGVIEVWVRDDGEGIPADFLPRAFERFALMDQSRASGGTGLGLAIVAEIAALHGATVSVEGSKVALAFSVGPD